ncbi:helix-turn-helix domain-containing protein [Candidatus Poribacteria bacterium]|nr:helix-turn-helix domain-containing protein [Candidatus Poribacteria bacterium]
MNGKLTVTELAKQLGVTNQAIHNRIRRGTLQAGKIDGAWYVEQEEAQRVLDAAKPVENDVSTSIENGIDKPCKTCEQWEEKYQEVVELNEYLKKQIEWFKDQLDKQTILLAQEQSLRVKALPKTSWLKRLFGRAQSEVAG